MSCCRRATCPPEPCAWKNPASEALCSTSSLERRAEVSRNCSSAWPAAFASGSGGAVSGFHGCRHRWAPPPNADRCGARPLRVKAARTARRAPTPAGTSAGRASPVVFLHASFHRRGRRVGQVRRRDPVGVEMLPPPILEHVQAPRSKPWVEHLEARPGLRV